MQKLCSVAGCANDNYVKNLCSVHYSRMRISGTTELNKLTDNERFMNYVTIDKNTQAWLWIGGMSGNGYGQFWFNGKAISSHRYAYIMRYGEIPKGMCVCHKYEELGRNNVNPDHLFLGTYLDNMADAANKNRTLFGGNNPSSVLTEYDVQEIRTSKLNGVELAEKFSVTPTTISHIRRGHHWKRENNAPDNIKTTLRLNNKTGYIGVRFKKNKYEAALCSRKLNISFYLGRFDNPIDAAIAYDEKAIEYYGDTAKLNFPRRIK